jgi:ankyrin repeat protein
MQKKIIVTLLLLSARCFPNEVEKQQAYNDITNTSEIELQSFETIDYSLNLENLPFDSNRNLNAEDPRLRQLRQRGISEQQIFRLASYLYRMKNIGEDITCYLGEFGSFQYHDIKLESNIADNMVENGKLLFEACASGNLSAVQLLLNNSDTCIINYIGKIKSWQDYYNPVAQVYADSCKLTSTSRANFLRLFPAIGLGETLYEYITPLDCALINKNNAIIQLLLEKGGKAGTKYIVFNDNPELVDIILKYSFVTIYEIALEAAKNSKNKILTELLKNKTFNQEQLSNLLKTYSKAQNFNYENLKYLLECAKKNSPEQLNQEILSNVVHDRKALELVYSYTHSGVDSALRRAFQNNNISSMEFLFSHGANPNLILDTATGETLLMNAVTQEKYGNLKMVKLLIANGANKLAKNTLGNTAQVLALQSNHKEIYRFLESGSTSCTLL